MRFIVSAETFQAIEEGRKTQFSFPAKTNLHDLNASPTGEFVIQAYPSISTIASMSLEPGQPAGIRSRVLVGPKFGYIELYRPTPEGWGYKIVASEAVPPGLKVLRKGRATSYTRKTSGGDVQLLIELRGFEYAIPILVM